MKRLIKRKIAMTAAMLPVSYTHLINTLLDKRKEYENQIASLKKQISDNDKRMQSLLQQKSQALFKGNKTDVYKRQI